MTDIDQIIEQIEKEIRETPYHKATEHHIGKLKARLAKLREEKINKILKSAGGGGKGFAVRHSGDATIALVGPPSVGKSSLLNSLTNAESRVGAYDFTTLNVVPGTLKYKGAYFQLMDIPGIIEGAALGKGKGKEVLSVARNADLILLIVDPNRISLIEGIKNELSQNGIRLDRNPPLIAVNKRSSGGIKINATTKLSLSFDTIRDLAKEFRLSNSEITIKENVGIDEVIDVFCQNRVYLPYLTVVNKIDLLKTVNQSDEYIYTSTQNNSGLDLLKEKIWEKLNFIRVYTKKNGLVDKERPLIVKKGLKLLEIARQLNLGDINKAKISGPGSLFVGQEVSLTYVPIDETEIEFLT